MQIKQPMKIDWWWGFQKFPDCWFPWDMAAATNIVLKQGRRKVWKSGGASIIIQDLYRRRPKSGSGPLHPRPLHPQLRRLWETSLYRPKQAKALLGLLRLKSIVFFNTDVTSRVVKRFHTLRHMGAKSRKLPRTEQRCFQLLVLLVPF